MKSCDEMLSSLFERRKQYITAQKRKRKLIIQVSTSLCCVCLVALLGFGMRQSDRRNTVSPEKQAKHSSYQEVKDKGDVRTHEEPINPAADNKIVVHQMNELPADKTKLNISLLSDDFVAMNKQELNEYYGINVFPLVPEDIKKEGNEQNYGIYKRDGGSGEVYWDATLINYANENFTRTIDVQIQKGMLPFSCAAFFDTIKEKSIINNLEVAIAKSDNGYFYAEFMYKNVGFRIIADGITEDELAAVISSLIK